MMKSKWLYVAASFALFIGSSSWLAAPFVNHVLRRGPNREEVAHRVAWAAVKKKYRKGNDDKWHPL